MIMSRRKVVDKKDDTPKLAKVEAKKLKKLVRLDKVEALKKQGWKEAKQEKSYSKLKAKTYTSDLVMMEK